MRFDVIVVGGGISGGLSSAAYLQKAGLKVAVVEKRHKAATFAVTSDPWPDALMDPHACQNWSPFSPAVLDLDLEKYGYRAKYSFAPNGMTHPEGSNCLIYLDPEMTGKSFGRYSAKDGELVKQLQLAVLQNAQDLLDILFFTPPEKNPELVMNTAYSLGEVIGIDSDTFSRMNGVQLLDMIFESEQVKQTFAVWASHHYAGHILGMGTGAFAVLLSFAAIGAGGWNHGGVATVPQAVTRCFLDHGGTILYNCPVEEIIVDDGRATGVRLSEDALYPGEAIFADRAVISDVGAKVTLELIGNSVMNDVDPILAAKMRYWKTFYRGGCTNFWVLKEQPSWKSAEWNPDIMTMPSFYHAWHSWDEAKSWMLDMQCNLRRDGLQGELSNFGALDPRTRSPEGYFVFRSEEPLPFHLPAEGGPERWDDIDFRKELMEIRNDAMEELAPGFRNLIIKHWVTTPLDIWRYNSAAVGGAIVGGDFSDDQWILGRMPYRMPVEGLYMANSTWPVATTAMAPGYNCAGLVAEDLGIRDQSWWSSRSCDWLFANLPSLVSV